MPPCPVTSPAQGARNHLSGLAAEEAVLADYLRRGYLLRDRRWRGGGAEIDLVFGTGRDFVMVEVKSGRTLDGLAERLSSRQLIRIAAAAEVYAAQHCLDDVPNMRLDLALVDGIGRIEVIENITQA